MSFDIPEGWNKSILEKLIVHILGGDWGQEYTEPVPKNLVTVKVIRGTEFKEWKKAKGKSGVIRIIKEESLKKRQLKENDIVIEISGGGPTQPVGRNILIDKEALELSEYPLVCSNFFRQIRLHLSLNAQYVTKYLYYEYSLGKFDKFQTQTTNLRNLNFNEFIHNITIPLPPLNEQKRIVAKIEALQERSQRVKTELDAIKPLLDQFRQSVLAAAFRGDLTADWRENNPDIEPAEVLLERIRIERRRRWEEAELEKMKAQGKIPKDDKWKEKYKEPEVVEIDDLPELLDGWCWINVNQIGEVSGGLTKNSTRNDFPLEFPYLRVANVYANKLDLSEIKTIKIQEEEYQRVLLQKGDLLIVEGNGSLDQIGRVAIWDGNTSPCLHQNHLIKIRFNPVQIGKYILWWLLSDNGRRQITRVASSTSGLHTLSLSKVSALPIPLPPLAEQQEIVRRIESLFKLADTIANQKSQIQNNLETLNQSILSKAFRGELVPQDPNDEPASVLLEHIRQEKAKTQSTKSKTKTQKINNSNVTQLNLPGID